MRFLTLLFLCISMPLQAQVVQLPVQCGPMRDQIEILKEKYQEKLVWMSQGQSSDGGLLYSTLWINNNTQTWTFMVINKDLAESCIFASGRNFEFYQIGESI